jgi:hypothetical protein
MNLDDRLRKAHRDQLDDVRQRVDVETSRRSITGRRAAPPGGYLVAAAAVILLLGGAGLLVRSAIRSSSPTVEIEAGTVSESTVSDSTTASSTTPAPAEDAEPTVALTVPDTEPPDAAPVDPSTPAETTPTPSETSSATAAETGSTAGVGLAAGVANDVCPSGSRAELETAALRYIGENRGWGRLFDLVDEQDGPHYYQAWEPGYPDPVTVEVTLTEPVLATEIRLAQDPFTPVDGDIFIEAAGQDLTITLEGTEGWKRHVFDEPTTLDRFTIRREAVTSNIMEVLVCVAPKD